MASTLNVIALISGGKDSLFSILHCIKNGHKVVALANLHPPALPGAMHEDPKDEASKDDMDSFMYQTVGHSIIPLYADALELPLYRKEITGTAVQTGRYYDTSSQPKSRDETEDLITLLEDVKQHHPKANALCTGAILSTYQRTRIESVAVRLGLIPLAYLWQYPALPPPPERPDSLTGLLDDMNASGCDARLIKLASGGVKESMMWSDVTDTRTRTRLVSGMAPFFEDHEFWLRGAVLGEGGEYETLAISGPASVWKKRIQVDDEQITIISGEGGTSHARIRATKLIDNDISRSQDDGKQIVRQPAMLDPQFSRILDNHRGFTEWQVSKVKTGAPSASSEPRLPRLDPSLATSAAHRVLVNETASEAGANAADQMAAIVQNVKSKLESVAARSLTPSNIISTLLLLSNMDDFTSVNPIYSTMFPAGEPNPPARVTIAADLPPKVRVSLNVILDNRNRESRRGLHVQSRSYWAPANIGPYSQAICEPLKSTAADVNIHDARLPEVVHMAGQIPLVPHKMDLLHQCFCYQAILSLQHLWRVGQERDVDLWPWGVAFLAAHGDSPVRAGIINTLWRQAHKKSTRQDESDEDEEAADIWHQQYNRHTHIPPTVGEHLHPLPNPNLNMKGVPLVIAEVTALPRGASVEWWSTGLANVRVQQEKTHVAWGTASILHAGEDAIFTSILISHDANQTLEAAVQDTLLNTIHADTLNPQKVVYGTAFVTGVADEEILPEGVACVPCKSIWGSLGVDEEPGVVPLRAALLLRLTYRNAE